MGVAALLYLASLWCFTFEVAQFARALDIAAEDPEEESSGDEGVKSPEGLLPNEGERHALQADAAPTTHDDHNGEQCETLVDPNGRWEGTRHEGGDYVLTCAPGFQVKGRNNRSATLRCPHSLHWSADIWCINIDDCAKLKHGCGALGVCVDKVNGYDCNCEKGYKNTLAKDGEIVCGDESIESKICGGHTCGAYGIWINLEGDDKSYDTGENRTSNVTAIKDHAASTSYRCECADGFRDDGTTCVRLDCGTFTDKIGRWNGNTLFQGEYTLKCPIGAFIWGGELTEVTISCPSSGKWLAKPRCISPASEALRDEIKRLRFWTFVALSMVCVCCAAIAAGLTLGVATLEPFQLNVLIATSPQDSHSEEERKSILHLKHCAEKVRVIVTGDHFLMVTLMLFNTIANEALPIFLDQVAGAFLSVILSVSVVLICGEILPSAVCTGPNQHMIAATCVPFVRLLQLVLSPMAKPVSWLSDYLVPHGDTSIKYSRAQLRGLLVLHGEPVKSEDAPRQAQSNISIGAEVRRGGPEAPYNRAPTSESHAAGYEASSALEESKPVVSEPELTLLNSVLDLRSLLVRNFDYARLSKVGACALVQSSQSAVDILLKGGLRLKPRAIVVLGGAVSPQGIGVGSRVSFEAVREPVPVPFEAVRGVLRPQALLQAGKEPLDNVCNEKGTQVEKQHMVGEETSMLDVLQRFEYTNSEFVVVVHQTGGNKKEVKGIILKVEVLAFMFSGACTDGIASQELRMNMNLIKRGMGTTRAALKRSQSTSQGDTPMRGRRPSGDNFRPGFQTEPVPALPSFGSTSGTSQATNSIEMTRSIGLESRPPAYYLLSEQPRLAPSQTM